MALILPRILYGWQVYAAGTKQNNRLDFRRGGTVYSATLYAGVYTADEFATEVARAMTAADTGSSPPTYGCSFNYLTLLFTITSTQAIDLLFGSGPFHTTDAAQLAGFNEADILGTTSSVSNNAVPAAPSVSPPAPSSWTLAEPVQYSSPVTAQAAGSPGLLLQRAPRIVQNTSDGGSVESIYFSTVKRLLVRFNQILVAEQTNLEGFLDWAIQGRRFTYQPDATSANLLKLVMDVHGDVSNAFSWPARGEADYGELHFLEQLT